MRKKVDFLILVIVLLAGFFAVQNAVYIGDWAHARLNNPSQEAVALADEAGMSDTGMKLFYRFNPEVVSRAELDDVCVPNKLGCVEGRSIYVLEYHNQVEYNQSVVTAAHEMLHVAYSRLNEREKEALHQLLETELQRPAADNIRQKLNGYPAEDFFTEAHSFIGTELKGLSFQLEEHYAQYFADRNEVLAAYEKSP